MADELSLDSLVEPLLDAIGETGRRRVAMQIAKALRASQARRISANKSPDGQAYAPRKPRLRGRKGSIRGKMFRRIGSASLLKAGADGDGAKVSFVGAATRRIARVHQFGLRDAVEPGSDRQAIYPARPLLGFSAADRNLVAEMILKHLSGM